jgi:CheY-like chemotaxis protein
VEDGMDDFLTKPVGLQDLREKLSRWLPALESEAVAAGSINGES